MSAIEYNNLLFEVSERLDELNILNRLLFMCRKKLASGSEGNIQDALSLFQKLEEKNYLGTDRLKVMKDLLREVKEWSLLEKVKKFESKRKEFNALLEKISRVLDELNDLERLIAMCKGKISEESEEQIHDVGSLFKGLEEQEILGTSCLDILKEILTKTEENELLKEVEEFEQRRNQEDKFESQKGRAAACLSSIAGWIQARSVGSVSFLAENLKRAINLVCNFRTIAGSLLTVNSGMALNKCSSREDYQETFNKVVLPSSSKLIEISDGSICFTVAAENLSAMKELWNIYKDGTLRSRLQEFLVTDEIKQLASGEDIEVTVYIDEQEYKEAYFDLILLHQAPNHKEEEQPGRRIRRNSDSFLCFKPNDDEVALMKLMERAENKWRDERQILELKIAKLEESRNAEKTTLETGILERPTRKRRRRNSDSNLYYKARDEEIEESEKEPGQTLESGTQLDFEKRRFVERYLENIHETRSLTTETSDSGVRTHGAPSDFEMQEITDDAHELCLKDLSEEVIWKLNNRLNCDDVARRQIYQSFGIDIASFRIGASEIRRSKMEIFNLFPDTPVKVLKEVFEALQLYDLVALLEERKPRTRRSLLPALALQGIEKLRNRAGRPTSYHSSAAVLIIDASEENSSTEGIGNFFKGLNVKSEVTVIQCRHMLKTYLRYDETIFMERRRETLTRKRRQEILEEMEREQEKFRTAVSAVTERWITNQENFSLFAVFFVRGKEYVLWYDSSLAVIFEDLVERIVTAIPKVVKLIVCQPIWISYRVTSSNKETLVVSANRTDGDFLTSMLEVFNKRWQTLDLISMMRELQRSLADSPQTTTVGPPFDLFPLGSHFGHPSRINNIKYNLSSLPRFKKQEEPTK